MPNDTLPTKSLFMKHYLKNVYKALSIMCSHTTDVERSILLLVMFIDHVLSSQVV